MKNKTTLYHFIVDQSGSMEGMEQQTIEGFNTQLEKIQELEKQMPEQKFLCSLTFFNSTVHDLIRNDNSLAFQQILKEMRNIYENEFTERKRYVYKRKIFKTLYDYLLFLCKNYESNNCKNLLITQQEFKLKLT